MYVHLGTQPFDELLVVEAIRVGTPTLSASECPYVYAFLSSSACTLFHMSIKTIALRVLIILQPAEKGAIHRNGIVFDLPLIAHQA
jgi:hypothetical protein